MRQIVLILVSLFFYSQSQASERIIERPSFAAWSSTSIEIPKIVCSDTATVLYIDAFYQPKMWIKIAKDSYIQADGKKYPIKYGIGMELDKEIWMPESGTYSFQMVFPPIPQQTQVIDFTEGDFKGAYSIWGIHLDGQNAISPLNGKKNPQEKTELGQPAFKYGTATLKGQVIGASPSMTLGGPIWITNLITGQYEQKQLTVQPDGSFCIQLPICHPAAVNLGCNFMSGYIYISPGETTSVEVNFPEICRSQSRLRKDESPLGEKYYFTGAFAALNNEMMNNPVNNIQVIQDFTQMLNDIHAMNSEQFKTYWLGIYEKMTQKLDQQENISDTYRRLLKLRLQIDIAEQLVSGSYLIEYAYRNVKNIPRDAELKDFTKPVFTDAYYDFLPQLMPNEPILLLSSTPYPIKVLQYSKLPLEKYMGANKGVLFDLIAAQHLTAPILEFQPLNDEQLAKAEAISPVFKEVIGNMNEKLKQTIEENKKKSDYKVDRVNLSNIPKEELFNAITTPYRGKVVFVDFWATWCGPCRDALKEAEPVKAEMKDKDVVFLYLASENSPKGTWEQMIPDIKGEHYRVTNEQWEYWVSKFGIRGVPSYMVLAKDGTPSFFQIGFPGANKMRELLREQLGK